ncbi:MAG: WecB/TagA/CpsF family glycosyltransferase, partial [Thioalkalivibrio sp.]|nr:WecB/TagA/CpsF family glycosyltransferase [Thioalkalivibrio sp.]
MSALARSPARNNVLGVGISCVSLDEAADRVLSLGVDGDGGYVCVTGAHGVVECQRDLPLRAIHNRATLVVPDGMPLVWLAKLAGFNSVTRVYGPDLMREVCERSEGVPARHFLYGGGPGVAEKLEVELTKRSPGLRIVGSYTPPFRPLSDAELDAVLRRITATGATHVWVGLSTPKQERFM